MSKWEDTPFKTIEEAFQMAVKFGLKPSAIIDTGGLRTFQMREKRQTTLMAQKAEGGPVKEKVLKRREPKPPMQPEEAPKWSKKYSYTVGPWTLTDLETLEDAEQRFKKEFINPENVEVLEMILIRNSTADRELEYEYARDARGVWHRVMERKRRPLNGKEV